MKAIELFWKMKRAYDEDQGKSLEKMEIKLRSHTDPRGWSKDVEDSQVTMPHLVEKNGKEVEVGGELTLFLPKFAS